MSHIETDSVLNCFTEIWDFDRPQWSRLIQVGKYSSNACICASVRKIKRGKGRREYQMFFKKNLFLMSSTALKKQISLIVCRSHVKLKPQIPQYSHRIEEYLYYNN